MMPAAPALLGPAPAPEPSDQGPRPPGGWLSVIGTLAIVAAIGAARDVLEPIALAALLTFLMSPAVSRLERAVGRVPAVLGAVLLVFAVAAGAGWLLVRQLDGIAADLPRFRVTLAQRIGQLRSASHGGAVGELQKTIDKVQQDLAAGDDAPRSAPVAIAEKVGGQSVFGVFGPMLGLAGSAGLVVTLVIFMLLERRDLRDRLVGLAGRGHIARTTRALDEAGRRVARQLLMQAAVNAIYMGTASAGLWALDVPYWAVWGVFGGALRFVPYVGPLVGLTTPVVVSLAASEGWRSPLVVLAFMVALELFTNLVLETVLYAGAAGVSQVGLLVAVTFWTWLWGGMGLLLAIPLTVCLVVIGKHVRGLEYLGRLMTDGPVASPAQTFYQRLLSRDTSDAFELVERHVDTAPPRTVYDALVLPALVQAETDRLDGRLDADGEQTVVAVVSELLADAADQVRRVEGTPSTLRPAPAMQVLGVGVHGSSDRLALDALARMVDDLPIVIDTPARLLSGEVGDWARAHGHTVVCLADLPPSSPARTRHLVRRLRASAPELIVLVGRWTASPGSDDVTALSAAGAHHVGVSFEQTRAFLQARLAAAPASAEAARVVPAAS